MYECFWSQFVKPFKVILVGRFVLKQLRKQFLTLAIIQNFFFSLITFFVPGLSRGLWKNKSLSYDEWTRLLAISQFTC